MFVPIHYDFRAADADDDDDDGDCADALEKSRRFDDDDFSTPSVDCDASRGSSPSGCRLFVDDARVDSDECCDLLWKVTNSLVY